MSFLQRLKQRFCKHVFVLADMKPRDEAGMVPWPCSKCGMLAVVEYGLLVPGRIEGPCFRDKGEQG